MEYIIFIKNWYIKLNIKVSLKGKGSQGVSFAE
jgi:hypothetical protein